jgi:hypothetical protein
MINETVFLGGCPVIRPGDGIYYEGRRVIRLGLAATPAVTWVSWYNSHADEQGSFDDAATALDDPSTTPDQKQNYIDAFGGSDDQKSALENYVATGGRSKLFAAPAKNYGPNPIAVVKASGPIEAAPGGSVLHPGTYTYSDVPRGEDGFEDWVQSNAKTVKRTVAQTSAAALPGGAEYYTDNVLVVYQDTLWPSSLLGLPTWLPPGTDPIKYWGKVTPPARPDWPSLPPNTIPWIGAAVAATVVVVGGALIVYYLPRHSPPPAPSRLP